MNFDDIRFVSKQKPRLFFIVWGLADYAYVKSGAYALADFRRGSAIAIVRNGIVLAVKR